MTDKRTKGDLRARIVYLIAAFDEAKLAALVEVTEAYAETPAGYMLPEDPVLAHHRVASLEVEAMTAHELNEALEAEIDELRERNENLQWLVDANEKARAAAVTTLQAIKIAVDKSEDESETKLANMMAIVAELVRIELEQQRKPIELPIERDSEAAAPKCCED